MTLFCLISEINQDIRGKVWYGKTRMVKRVCLAILKQYQHVKDGQTSCESIVCAVHSIVWY